MHISNLKLRNFRNFRNAKFKFEKGVNTLIGENGSGKTNAFHAIRLLLDETLPRSATSLQDYDFNRSLKNWRGHWIIISVTFDELDLSEGCQLLRHAAGHMDESKTGTYTLYFRPKFELRKRLFEESAKGKAEALALVAKITIDNYEPYWTGRAKADFSDQEIYQTIVGNPAQGLFPNPEQDDQDLLGVRIPPIHREIACTFIKALRDVINELQSYRGNPLLTLLRGLESEIEIADSEQITSAIKTLNINISSLEEIRSLSAGIQKTLHDSVGRAFSPSISIESTLPDNMEMLLKKLGILVGDADGSGYKGEMSEQSLGNANLIYLALKFLEYQRKLSSDRVAHFLLIEEPEAHLHAHVQKTLFGNLAESQTQVIVSTHSTQISSIARIKSVNVFSMRSQWSAVHQPSNNLDARTISRIERYVDAVRSTLLFAKGVMLVEGEAELIMIPALVRAAFGLGVDELGVSVIAMDSAFFEHIAVIFHKDRIQRYCSILSDLDESIVDLGADPADDDAEDAHFRASQKSGVERKAALEQFADDNQWIEVFLANHTFEIDLLQSGNAHEAQRTLPSIYKNQDDIAKSKALLQSPDKTISGREMLRLAKKVGKGWFALLLAEVTTVQTRVPDYILRALAFASQDVANISMIREMGLFRLRELNEVGSMVQETFPETIEGLAALSPDDFVKLYRERLPSDDLTKLLGFLEELVFFL